jgi:hypothetical protein
MRRTVLLLACTALAVLLACGVALAAVSDTADSGTVNTDGRISAILKVGDRVYLGGNFTQVNGEARSHLAAVDAETGRLTGWSPSTNATGNVFALAASPDGSRVYAGGAFTSVNGKTRKRIAAIDAATGALDPAFRADADNGVRALAVSGNGDVYAGGAFGSVGGQPRARLALVDGATGEVDPGWAPTADGLVRDLEPSPDGSRIYAGGEFKAISGQPRAHLVGLDAAGTGAIAWRPLTSPNGKVYDLAARSNSLYSAEGGGGGEARSYDASTGALVWRARGDGDVQAVAPLDGRLYIGGHFQNFSGQSRPFLAALDASTGLLDPWNPTANAGDGLALGVFALTPDGSEATGTARIYAGGDFTRVSGLAHQHFARFSE